MAFKNHRFISLAALLFGALGVLLFFAPLFYILPHVEEYSGTYEEARVFFVSFFADNKLFFTHSAAVLSAFLALLCATASIFREKRRAFALLAILLSLSVICTYIAGYEKIFALLFNLGI